MDGAHTDSFIFNIKPFALMTQHPAEMSGLPKHLRQMVPAEERSNHQLTRPSKEVIDMAFQMFWSAMAPPREAGKLGMISFQFPPYFISEPANLDYLARLPERGFKERVGNPGALYHESPEDHAA